MSEGASSEVDVSREDRPRPRLTRWALGAALVAVLACMALWESLEREYPVADVTNAVGTIDSVILRGRLVEEESDFDPLSSRPSDELSQDELEDRSLYSNQQ